VSDDRLRGVDAVTKAVERRMIMDTEDELILKSDAVKEMVRHFHVSEVDARWILSETKGVKECGECPLQCTDDCK